MSGADWAEPMRSLRVAEQAGAGAWIGMPIGFGEPPEDRIAPADGED